MNKKTLKIAHRRPTKCRNREKTPVVGRRNAKIAKKRPSSVDETQKTTKNARHPWMKARNRQKNARHPWMKAKIRRKTLVIRG